MITASIIGVTGYTGIELLRILQSHPEIKIANVFTESYVGEEIADVYPHLKKHVNLKGEKLNYEKITNHSDVVFISLPHGHAIEIGRVLLAAGKKVIDLGADFRLKNPHDYSAWYKQEPPPQELLTQAAYGLPEKGIRETIQQARLIANPGCYPTASLLATIPALKAKIIDAHECMYDAKSGVSGAGRSLSLKSHFCEGTENLSAYQIAGAHRHTPEIEQELNAYTNTPIKIQFTPHLIPIVRGMMVTGYFKLSKSISVENIHEIYKEYYQNEPFVRVCPLNKIPDVKHVRGTNYCDIGLQVDTRTGRLITISVIDNLIKGASGQAIQNMNIMYQLPETMGLLTNSGIYP